MKFIIIIIIIINGKINVEFSPKTARTRYSTVLQVNMHRLMEWDSWRDAILPLWRPWRRCSERWTV